MSNACCRSYKTTRGLRRAPCSSCLGDASLPQVCRRVGYVSALRTDLRYAGKRLFRIWLCMPLREVKDINARCALSRTPLASIRAHLVQA